MLKSVKGSVLEAVNPFLTVDLAPYPNELPQGLPKVAGIHDRNEKCDEWRTACNVNKCDKFVARALLRGTPVAHAVVTTLAMVLTRKFATFQNTDHLPNFHEPDELVTEAWPLVQSVLDWSSWWTLFSHVRQSMVLTSDPHPLEQYATHILPKLDSAELKSVYSLLQPMLKLPTRMNPENLLLSLVQAIHDSAAPNPIVILPFNPCNRRMRHSCLPNAAWDWNSETRTLQAIALYDLTEDEELSFSLIEGVTLQERQRSFHDIFNRPCDCIRCQCECTNTLPEKVRDVVRLGHLHFQQLRLDDALTCYRHAVQLDLHLDDIWHAIGAVLLTQNRFRLAQRHWRDACQKHPFLKENAGIALQLAKQEAYGYLNDKSRTEIIGENIRIPKYTSYFGGLCFVTDEPALSPELCSKVIEWAESVKNWTTSRHYAVPTNDIPVHTIPRLLAWFNQWMDDIVRPLLGKQFGGAPNQFYCHDAFIVRYEATTNSNFLPIHVDESTHSFVVNLNGDFEGGGTYFCDYNTTLAPKTPGCLVTFRGSSLRHGGNVVTSGKRYILAVFLYHDPPSRKRALPIDTKKESFSFGFDL